MCLDKLPIDILALIANHLDMKDYNAFVRTCYQSSLLGHGVYKQQAEDRFLEDSERKDVTDERCIECGNVQILPTYEFLEKLEKNIKKVKKQSGKELIEGEEYDSIYKESWGGESGIFIKTTGTEKGCKITGYVWTTFRNECFCCREPWYNHLREEGLEFDIK